MSPHCSQVCMEELLTLISVEGSWVHFLLPDFNASARISTLLRVLRWGSDALPLWMERLRHCRLLFLYRHHLPCCRAGVSPRCKYPEERCLKRKAEKHAIHLFRDKRGNLRFILPAVSVSRILLHRFFFGLKWYPASLCVGYCICAPVTLPREWQTWHVSHCACAHTIFCCAAESHPASPPIQEQEHQVQWVGSAVCVPLGVECLEFLHTHNSEWF